MADKKFNEQIERTERTRTITITGGACAGIIGGILMGVAGTLWAYAIGMGASAPWQGIAATFYGPMAFVGAAGVTAIGVLTHLAISAIFGAVFAALVPHARSAGKLFLLGIPYGVAVWAVMTYVFVPVFDATLDARIPMMAVMWFFLHWIYGAFTGAFLPAFGRTPAESAPVRDVPPVQRVA